MAKSVFVKAWLNELDIADAVESIRDESDIEKGDYVELRVKSDKALDLANHKNVVAGAKLEYQYGFIGLLHSSNHVARVVNINIDFTDKRVRLEIKALDKGIEMKKSNAYKIWTNVTLSDIATAIAANYGMDARVEPTAKVYKSLPQGGRSDWSFLQYLVKREAGTYQLYASDYTLYLEKNIRSKDSKRSFELGENIISFSTQVKEATQKAQASTLGTIDDKTGKIQTPITEKTTTDQKDGRFKVGDMSKATYKTTYKFGNYDQKSIKQEVIAPVKEKSESKAFQDNLNDKSEKRVVTASLTIELDPTIRAGEVITVKVPVEKLSGNWFVEKAVHTIDNRGGITELSLNKVGTSKPVKNVAAASDGKVNNTEGAKGVKDTRKIFMNNNGDDVKK